MLERITSTIVFLVMAIGLSAQVNPLPRMNWEQKNYDALGALIRENGNLSPSYNPACQAYAVFDFDNTISCNDISETLIDYMIDNLLFRMTPEQFHAAFSKSLPDLDVQLDDFDDALKGRKVTIGEMLADIEEDFTYIWNHYSGYNGNMSLEKIRKTRWFKDFKVRFRWLYDSIYGSVPNGLSDEWYLHIFERYTPEEIREITSESVDYWMTKPLKRSAFKSGRKGRSGRLTSTIYTGFRLIPEMVSLISTLKENGIDVYVCSASQEDVVEGAACNPKYGLNIPADHVYGIRLNKDSEGKTASGLLPGYPVTWGPGKVEAIRAFMAPGHCGKDPVLVGGDSNGDYDMMVSFPRLRHALIINKNAGGKIGSLCEDGLKDPSSRNLVQGRDENRGFFIPSKEPVLLK